jgi:hypothetical protein
VGAALDDAPLLHDQDLVSRANGGQAVDDDERPLDGRLGMRIDAACGLVQDEQPRLRQRGAGDTEQLALTLAEHAASLAKVRGVATRSASVPQALDELMGARPPRRRFHLGVCCGEVAVADVLGYGGGKEETVLRHDADPRA